jgi:acyl-CoA reductase-like NAD-dependent aldehyde dehydrogenase
MLHDPDLLALQEVRTKIELAWAAFQKYRAYTQEQIDAIVERMAAAAREHAQRLADLAVEETGYGNARDKLIKNLLACDILPRSLRGMKTVGVLRDCKERQVLEMAVPMGVIAAILPTTNPTSTAIYKIIIALKAGNAIVLSPHPRAKRCTCETAEIMSRAALQAGSPDGIIQCITQPSVEATSELMRHRRTAAILSTGGSGIVRAAYSSGKPAFGVGPGNVPVVIEESADIADAVAKVVQGKSFDYGTLCSSEQTLIAQRSLRDRILEELRKQRAYICSDAEKQALTRTLLAPPNWTVNPECVGQAPLKIAQMAGFKVSEETSILAAEIGGVGKEHPLSAEKLSPVLSLLFVESFSDAVAAAEAVLRFKGLGHTCGIYSKNDERIREYAARMPAMRVICNTPTTHGSVGITTNVFPAMTLGCGAIAGNITGDNISPKHLINVKRLAYAVREPEDAFERPAAVPATLSSQISSAVERFLAEKGFDVGKPTTANLVDRFLSSKRVREEEPAPAPETRPAPPPEVPAPAIVDFVCEQDVRLAIQKSQKIYIGPKTIVTPSARDLASQYDTLVVAQRK